METHSRVGMSGLRTVARRFMIALLPAVLLLASSTKLIDWDTWRRSLDTFSIVSDQWRAVISVIIPGIELTAFMLILVGRSRAANCMAITIVLVISLAVVLQWILHEAPTCSCFGQWIRHEELKQSSTSTLVRNFCFVIVGLFGFMLARSGDEKPRSSAPSRHAD